VVIAAPHTSNWDFPVMMAFAFAFEAHVHWLGKDGLFRGPGYWLFRWLGGIPVDRSRAGGLVGQAAQTFAAEERLILAVPPEGTRSRGRGWRSGFYRIAHSAKVPVVMAYADFERRVGGIGEIVVPSGDLDADMATFKAFYSDIRGMHPHLESEIRIAASAHS
jgi:1-acyl-sn-glycerol-3-phosphate acyltransferase